jgi:hypothetical protein
MYTAWDWIALDLDCDDDDSIKICTKMGNVTTFYKGEKYTVVVCGRQAGEQT